MSKVPAIGLSGYASSGKTTAANWLETAHNYRRLHIAEPLRDMLRALLHRFGMDDELITRYLTGDLKEQVIPCLGITSRMAQITLGTEWGRQLVSPDLWANCWRSDAAQHLKPMNDSVRFPNEETAIRRLGGKTILIRRAGCGPAAFIGWQWLSKQLYRRFGIMWGVHPSERVDLLKPDFVIDNDGSLSALYQSLDAVLESLNS